MNNAILKIDSFNQRNVVLINGNPVPMNSAFMNYYSKPITEVAGKILETIEAEFNDSFTLDVYGNAFEQALLMATVQKNGYSLCERCDVHNTAIALSQQERLALIGDYIQPNITVPFALLSDDTVAGLPAWNNIQFDDDADKKIIVTADARFAWDNVQRGDIVILVDGQAEDISSFRRNCVVCCTANNLQAVLEGCIGTCWLNTKIAQIITEQGLQKDPVKGIACLVEPTFFVVDKITLDSGVSKPLPVVAVPEGADASELLIKLREPTAKYENGKLTGIAAGTTVLEGYSGSPIPVFSAQIEVVEHNYVHSFEVEIEDKDGTLCVGKIYPLSIAVFPENAEDADTLTVECLTPATARIDKKYLTVLAPGEVTVKVHTSHAEKNFGWTAKQKLSRISVSEPPTKVYIGDTFPISVKLSPEETYDSAYKWITSDSSVAVVGKDKFGNELVKATGIGKATIRCVSKVDKNIFDEITVEVLSTLTTGKSSETAMAASVLTATVVLLMSLLQMTLALSLTILVATSVFFGCKAYFKKQGNKLLYLFVIVANVASIILTLTR